MKRKHWVAVLVGTVALTTAGFMKASSGNALVVHEWGTFTSLQGSDGVPLRWKPLETSELPKFVHSWAQPGLGRLPSGLLAVGPKGVLVTLQRMETPVIYFYTDRERAVDVTVRFPQGGITEWYPQAAVGPSFVPPGPLVNKLDSGLHELGLPPSLSVNKMFAAKTIEESAIRWSHLRLHPAIKASEAKLPLDSSGSHYFAARETDSAYIEALAQSATNTRPEVEKFLFYRGVANFSAPLFVSMPGQHTVSLANLGTNTLSHLFVLQIRGETAALAESKDLKPATSQELHLDFDKRSRPVGMVREEIQIKMQEALVAEGLFPREAKAMVETWKESWFAEPGVRALYLLPRAWTDSILPITVDPLPRQMVRVMIGRAELITPEVEQRLVAGLKLAREGGPTARAELENIAKDLGRFAEPAFQKALSRIKAKPDERGRLLTLLYQREKR